jgi:hypothetical protein
MPYARKDQLTWQKRMHYHIYNRGVSKSTLFREPANYRFVLTSSKNNSHSHWPDLTSRPFRMIYRID